MAEMRSDKIFRGLFARHPVLRPCGKDITGAFNLLLACCRRRGTVLACGNGGSSADADHIVAELMKGFMLLRPLPEGKRRLLEHPVPISGKIPAGGPGPAAGTEAAAGTEDGRYLAEILQEALPAISLGAHGALISAFANDRAADAVFAQQVYGYGRPGDLLVCFSTSGNSRNVVLAARTARALGLPVVGLTGRDGGALAPLCDAAVMVPEREAYKVQELHLPVYHALAAAVEAELFSG